MSKYQHPEVPALALRLTRFAARHADTIDGATPSAIRALVFEVRRDEDCSLEGICANLDRLGERALSLGREKPFAKVTINSYKRALRHLIALFLFPDDDEQRRVFIAFLGKPRLSA